MNTDRLASGTATPHARRGHFASFRLTPEVLPGPGPDVGYEGVSTGVGKTLPLRLAPSPAPRGLWTAPPHKGAAPRGGGGGVRLLRSVGPRPAPARAHSPTSVSLWLLMYSASSKLPAMIATCRRGSRVTGRVLRGPPARPGVAPDGRALPRLC